MFNWLKKKKLKLNLNYKRNRKPWQNNDLFIAEELAPKNFFLVQPVIRFFTEGEVIFNSFLELGWSIEHHLFFLDYYRVLTHYIKFFVGDVEVNYSCHLLLFSWHRACQSITFSKILFTLEIFLEHEENLYTFTPKQALDVVIDRFKDPKNFEVFQSLDFFPIFSNDQFLNDTAFKLAQVKKWNHIDSFHLNELKGFLEKVNFWYIWHTTIFLSIKTGEAFFAELRELQDEFLTELKPQYWSTQEDEFANTAQMAFEDEEYKAEVFNQMRLVLFKTDFDEYKYPISDYALGNVVPSLDLYYLIIKGFEISHFLHDVNWGLSKVSLFYYHLDLLDTFLLNLVTTEDNSNQNYCWKKYSNFNTKVESDLFKTSSVRWATANFLFGQDTLEIRNYLKSKKWFAEEVYLPNRKEFVVALWTVQERFSFIGDKWHKLYYTLLEILDLKLDRPLLAAAVSLIYKFLNLPDLKILLNRATVKDILEKTKFKKKASIELLLYNQKFIRSVLAEHKKRLKRFRVFKPKLIKFLKIRINNLLIPISKLKNFYWQPTSFNKQKILLSQDPTSARKVKQSFFF